MKKCLLPAVLLVLALLAGCQETEQPFVVPVGEEVSNTNAFEVTVPEGKKVSFYVERLQKGKQVEIKQLVFFLVDTKPVMVQATEWDGQMQYLYLTQAGDVLSPLEQVRMDIPQGVSLESWLTPEEAETVFSDASSKVVLYARCVNEGTSIDEMGGCTSFVEDATFAERYDDVHLVWAVLEEA